MHDKPLVMMAPARHFDGLRSWLRGLLGSGYVSQAAMDTLVVVDDVDAAIAACTPR
jgi:predicted Rossmann-fold nucleotide-binding protein